MRKLSKPKLLHVELMGDPFMPDMSEMTEKIRRNLLAIGSLATLIHLLDIYPDKESSFMGISLSNFTPEKLDFIFFTICVYLTIHFLVRCSEFYKEVRIRLTGADHKASQGSEDNYFFDSIVNWDDDKNYPSTLYRFWYAHVHLQHERPEHKLKKDLEKLNEISPGDHDELKSKLSAVIHSYERMYSSISAILNSDRIKLSLERFDQLFSSLQKGYIARIIIIEMGIPLTVSATAITYSFSGFWKTLSTLIM